MKKILGIAALIMLVPMVAFSMEAVSDVEMNEVTGAGVNLHFDAENSADGVVATTTMTNLSYTDNESSEGADDGGSVTLEGALISTVTIKNDSNITIDVDNKTNAAAGENGVIIGGLNNVSFGFSLPEDGLVVKINTGSIGTIGGTISTTMTGLSSLVISAHN